MLDLDPAPVTMMTLPTAGVGVRIVAPPTLLTAFDVDRLLAGVEVRNTDVELDVSGVVDIDEWFAAALLDQLTGAGATSLRLWAAMDGANGWADGFLAVRVADLFACVESYDHLPVMVAPGPLRAVLAGREADAQVGDSDDGWCGGYCTSCGEAAHL